MALELTVSEHGIDRIGKTPRDGMWTAFADPRREKPMWATPEGRAKLDEYGRCCRAEANNGHGSGSHTPSDTGGRATSARATRSTTCR